MMFLKKHLFSASFTLTELFWLTVAIVHGTQGINAYCIINGIMLTVVTCVIGLIKLFIWLDKNIDD